MTGTYENMRQTGGGSIIASEKENKESIEDKVKKKKKKEGVYNTCICMYILRENKSEKELTIRERACSERGRIIVW